MNIVSARGGTLCLGAGNYNGWREHFLSAVGSAGERASEPQHVNTTLLESEDSPTCDLVHHCDRAGVCSSLSGTRKDSNRSTYLDARFKSEN